MNYGVTVTTSAYLSNSARNSQQKPTHTRITLRNWISVQGVFPIDGFLGGKSVQSGRPRTCPTVGATVLTE